MSKETKILLGIIIGLLVVIGGLFVVNAKTPGKYDDFAMCLQDTGAKFYGAYWCPHCAEQKRLFGKSVKYLPYIECAVSDDEVTQQCKDANITGYPTWEFADGTRPFQGSATLEQLSEKTGCVIPGK